MKVGDYARSSEGDLGKIVRINNSHDIELEDSWVSYDEEDLKSSSNIIDLIEVGDYVNGYLVTDKSLDAYNNKLIFVGQRKIEECGYYKSYYSNDIKSIVTKEQFSSMEYKVN